MLCFECGNEIEDGAVECPVCAANRERGSAVPEDARDCPQCGRSECSCEAEPEFVLCTHCGNTVEAGTECPVCAANRQRRKSARSAEDRHLCLSCGNEIFGTDPCPVCTSGRAPRRPRAAKLTLCRKCGNEVPAGSECPICAAGRAPRKPRPQTTEPTCPLCEQVLEEQDWDGVAVLLCADCNGCFFRGNGLERMLDKLRTEAGEPTLATVLAEFRDRHRCSIPKAVRYKPCPICGLSMTRRNYAGVSGVIIDICTHGTWTDQAAFGELTDFVSRGGDLLSRRRH